MADIAAEKLAGYFLEWQRIEDEKAKLSDQSKALFKAMKDDGYDTKAARVSFREKRFELDATADDVAKAEEADAIVDLYRTALTNGLAARAHPAHARVENKGKFGAAKPLTDTQEQPETKQSSVESSERQTTSAVSKPEATPMDEARKGPSGTAAQVSPSPETPQANADEAPAAQAPASSAPIPNPQPSSSLGNADKAEAGSSLASAAHFDNPRCKSPDGCTFAHSRNSCWECTMAWATRPKDEQVRLWQEAVAASETEAA